MTRALAVLILSMIAALLGSAVSVSLLQLAPLEVPEVSAAAPEPQWACTGNGSEARHALSVCDERWSKVTVLAWRISVQEGFGVDGSIPRRLNNPGSLVYVGQAGALRHASGYAVFATPDKGWDALEMDLAAKLDRGMTVVQILDVWCAGGCSYKAELLRLPW